MGANYYPQSDHRPETVTVAQLAARMAELAEIYPDAPVIFMSPRYGAFGGNTTYALQTAQPLHLERREVETPAGSYIDDETGEEVAYEASVNVLEEWRGVVLA